MSDKKPVWVDQDAHAVLKKYSKLVKASMVDIASRLVLDRLSDLSPDAGLEAEEAAPAVAAPVPVSSPAAAPPVRTTIAPPMQKPKKRTTTTKPKRPQKRLPGEDKNVRFLGGIWLV